MFISRLRNFAFTLLAVLFAVVFSLGIRVNNLSRLSLFPGERTFFLDSASSQGLMKKELGISDLFRVKGECVSFSFAESDGGRDALIEEIVRQLGAEIIFEEEVNEVISYYCYTPIFLESLILQGKRINLHVAISKARCVVGTPIIFGGF